MASYKNAIQWMADNDGPGDAHCAEHCETVCASMVSDLWNKPLEKVARDVWRQRARGNARVVDYVKRAAP